MSVNFQLYVDPLKASSPPILNSRQMTEIFSNIHDIIQVNTELLRQLEDRMAAFDQNQRCLGDVFMKLSPFLKIYSVYVKNYQNAMRLVGEYEKKNSAFGQLLSETLKSQNSKGLSLQAYLLTPVQRIPRYKLLLDDLLRNTGRNHPDRKNLESAFISIESGMQPFH
jgi:hypothetical protein